MTRALVILGAAVWPGEVPSPTLTRRVNFALGLWAKGGFSHFVVSGGLGKNPPTEAEVMKRLLSSAGILEEQILLEDRSVDTETNARFSIRIMRENSIGSATVVTDRYHCLRAFLTFRKFGMKVSTASADQAFPKSRWQVSVKGWCCEVIALPFYILKLYVRECFRGRADLN